MSFVTTFNATDACPVLCTLVTSLPSPIAGNFGFENSAGRPLKKLAICPSSSGRGSVPSRRSVEIALGQV
eukprot:24777-Pelagococcus_subviridis.AAC.4